MHNKYACVCILVFCMCVSANDSVYIQSKICLNEQRSLITHET